MSGIKSSASKRTPRQRTPSSACSLDNTVVTLRTQRNLTYQDPANLTLNPGIFVIPTDDRELQCDFAYNEYLQSLLNKQITEKYIKRFKTLLNDQLSIQTDVLMEQERMERVLQKKIEIHEVRAKLDDAYAILEKRSNELANVLNPDVEGKLDKLIELLETACDQLSLHKVKAFSSQEEYDKFSDLLVTCTDTLQHISKFCSNIEKVKPLVHCLNNYKKLCEDAEKAEESVISLQTDLINSMLEVGSNMFAKFRGYD